MEAAVKRYVGLDLAKRTIEVCIVRDGSSAIERAGGVKTDGKGRERPARLLRESDVVAMEACASAFLLARYLKAEVGCEVYILNPGKLRMIWQSTKKTDREDALKIAKFVQRYPQEELPPVSLPTEQEEELRQLISMKQFLVKSRTALINRPHALYMQAGETGLRKKDLASAESRAKRQALLVQRGGCRALRSIVVQSAWAVQPKPRRGGGLRKSSPRFQGG